MPLIWRVEKWDEKFAYDLVVIGVLAIEKAGVSYPEREDDGPCVLEERSGIRFAACSTHDKDEWHRILSLPPIKVRVEQDEVDECGSKGVAEKWSRSPRGCTCRGTGREEEIGYERGFYLQSPGTDLVHAKCAENDAYEKLRRMK